MPLNGIRPRAKMAALKWGWAVMFIWIFITLILTCKCDSVENSDESVRGMGAGRSESQHGEHSSNAELQAEQLHWDTTDFGFNDNKADSGVTGSPGDTKSFTPPPAKDHFQEELVIRPLHSGDIYGSFQFRTQLNTDFLQEEKKGCL